MADNIYRDYDQRSRRDRSESIFSDESSGGRSWNDDRRYGRSRDNDRGLFEKAGEEIRSWFGDDDNRGERSRYGSDRGAWKHDRERSSSGHFDRDRGYRSPERGYDRDSGGVQSWGQANDLDDDSNRRTGSHPDDHYRTWRERQMAELDRDYEDYCRERQQQFDSDFSTWRSERRSERDGNETRRSGGRSSGSGGMTDAGGTSRAGDTTAASGRTGITESSGSSGRSRSTDGESSDETGGTGKIDSSVRSSANATQGRGTSRTKS